ncbi:MAG: polysaccharide deacetylase family protein [Phycisphaerales bacterium]|nr:MAG: polysaccharide deacetylase family protein [Phycisphaerales bacterium]
MAGLATPGAVILIYHRVAEIPRDPQLLCVRRRHFGEQLEVLREHYHPMSLLELVGAVRDRKLPKRAVVVTFDDGYADNLVDARPLLADHGVCATVFVVGGDGGPAREFWWDELERLLLETETLPRALRMTVGADAWHWQLGESAWYRPEQSERDRGWNVQQPDNPGPRQEMYRALHERLRTLPLPQRRKVMDSLQAWSGAERVVRPTHRSLATDEIRELADGGLVEIGAHTLTHPVLATLPTDAQQLEIERNKAHLEQILDRPVRSFSYPYGTRSDYSVETVKLVRRGGFACACANFAGVVRSDADSFELPRVLVRDWDGDEFARRLRQAWGNG